MADNYVEPTNYGEAEDASEVSVDVKYGLRLTTDITNTGKPNTLPTFREADLEYAYTKEVKRTGDTKNEISWERIAHYRPISRPYGETIKSDEGTRIGTLVYAMKYLPRADELTAYVDLNLNTMYTKDDGFLDFEPIVMGDQVPTPTPSWTPTITQTITNTQMATPTPSPTESPDLQAVETVFRELWKDNSTDYFTFKYHNGYFGVRFRYRKYAMTFFREKIVEASGTNTQSWFETKYGDDDTKIKKIFNPFRRIKILINNVTKASDSNDVIPANIDHKGIDVENTFPDDNTTERDAFNAMIGLNENIFGYEEQYVMVSKGSDLKQNGFELFIPLNTPDPSKQFYNSDGKDREVKQYEYFTTQRSDVNSKLSDFNDHIIDGNLKWDCKYFIFRADMQGSEFDIQDIKIYPIEEEQRFVPDTDDGSKGTYEWIDSLSYPLDDSPLVFDHKELINGEKLYLFTMPTPTPSFTPSPTPTVTITHPTPTPTFTVSPTETLSNTPTPTVTITHPTPTPSPTITKTLRLFNVNEEKGVNIIGTMNIIQRDGTITYADNLFNLGPVFHLEL